MSIITESPIALTLPATSPRAGFASGGAVEHEAGGPGGLFVGAGGGAGGEGTDPPVVVAEMAVVPGLLLVAAGVVVTPAGVVVEAAGVVVVVPPGWLAAPSPLVLVPAVDTPQPASRTTPEMTIARTTRGRLTRRARLTRAGLIAPRQSRLAASACRRAREARLPRAQRARRRPGPPPRCRRWRATKRNAKLIVVVTMASASQPKAPPVMSQTITQKRSTPRDQRRIPFHQGASGLAEASGLAL